VQKPQYDQAPLTTIHQDALPEVARKMTMTLSNSSGVHSQKSSDALVVAEEISRWREEFGEETAEKMAQWVDGHGGRGVQACAEVEGLRCS